jgi:hypothetical protein
VHAQVFRHEDPLLLGVDYFDAEAELTTPNVMEAWVNRAMVKASSMVAAVCESTKFMAQPVKDCGCDSGPSRDHRSASTEEAADALGNMNIKLTLALHWGPSVLSVRSLHQPYFLCGNKRSRYITGDDNPQAL